MTGRAARLALALALLAGPAARAEEAAPRNATLGVAPFEQVAPPGELAPDLSGLLAERLGERLARVVGPDALGAPALAAPAPDMVRSWASAAQVAAVLVGRTTRIGSALNVDLWLRSGATGEVAGSYVAEIPDPEQLEPALARLADRIASEAEGLVASRHTATVPAFAGGPFDFGGFDRDEPLQIRSDALDASQNDGRRKLVFSRNVEVSQADLHMTTDELVALYPAKSSQPDRLIARGRVVMTRGPRTATCSEAVYHRAEGRLVCRGTAELRDGDDRVSGDVIEFDIDSNRIAVSGGASVLLHPLEESPHEDAGDAQPDPDVGAAR